MSTPREQLLQLVETGAETNRNEISKRSRNKTRKSRLIIENESDPEFELLATDAKRKYRECLRELLTKAKKHDGTDTDNSEEDEEGSISPKYISSPQNDNHNSSSTTTEESYSVPGNDNHISPHTPTEQFRSVQEFLSTWLNFSIFPSPKTLLTWFNSWTSSLLGETRYFISRTFFITWYFFYAIISFMWFLLRPWLPLILPLSILFNVSVNILCSVPGANRYLHVICPPSNSGTFHLVCRIPVVKPLMWCVNQNGTGKLGSNAENLGHNSTELVEDFVESHKILGRTQEMGIQFIPLSKDMIKIRKGLNRLETFVSQSSIPDRTETVDRVRSLIEGTFLLEDGFIDFSIAVESVARMQSAKSRDTARLLQLYAHEPNFLEKISRWLPLTPRQYYRLRSFIQPASVRLVPGIIKGHIDFMNPHLEDLANAALEIETLVKQQISHISVINNLNMESRISFDSTRDLIIEQRTILSHILIKLKVSSDDAKDLEKQIAALDHMERSYDIASRFFDIMRQDIVAIQKSNRRLMKFGDDIERRLRERTIEDTEWFGEDWDLRESKFHAFLLTASQEMLEQSTQLDEQQKMLLKKRRDQAFNANS